MICCLAHPDQNTAEKDSNRETNLFSLVNEQSLEKNFFFPKRFTLFCSSCTDTNPKQSKELLEGCKLTDVSASVNVEEGEIN